MPGRRGENALSVPPPSLLSGPPPHRHSPYRGYVSYPELNLQGHLCWGGPPPAAGPESSAFPPSEPLAVLMVPSCPRERPEPGLGGHIQPHGASAHFLLAHLSPPYCLHDSSWSLQTLLVCPPPCSLAPLSKE